MPRPVDLSAWNRRDHYRFFRGYEQPWFTVCADVDVTGIVERSRAASTSFFLGSLHAALTAANGVPELRYRLRGDAVVEHDVVHGGATVLRPDQTFAFAFVDFHEDLSRFGSEGSPRIAAAEQSTDPLHEEGDRDDLIFFSVLPWIAFTSFQHAMRSPSDSNPRIVFGRRRELEGRFVMPVSLSLHHALADGWHAGRFYELLTAAAIDESSPEPEGGETTGASTERPVIAVLGASRESRKFGNKCVRAYLRAGWEVLPVNPSAESIEGIPCLDRLDAIDRPIDRLSVYRPPEETALHLEEIAELDVGEVWLNPGSTNGLVTRRARELGIPVVEGCSIVDIGASPAEFP